MKRNPKSAKDERLPFNLREYARRKGPSDRPGFAAHGWEFLLDNHLEGERERREAVKHIAVLGEN